LNVYRFTNQESQHLAAIAQRFKENKADVGSATQQAVEKIKAGQSSLEFNDQERNEVLSMIEFEKTALGSSKEQDLNTVVLDSLREKLSK
jgi:hypothetical protein